MQISDICYHHEKHGYDELHHLKVFLQKKLIKKKNKGQIFYIFVIFYLTCFTTVPIFKSIGPLVAKIWGGGAKMPPPPPWTQVLKITQWDLG